MDSDVTVSYVCNSLINPAGTGTVNQLWTSIIFKMGFTVPQHKIIQLFPLFPKRFPFFSWQTQTANTTENFFTFPLKVSPSKLVWQASNKAEHRAHQTLEKQQRLWITQVMLAKKSHCSLQPSLDNSSKPSPDSHMMIMCCQAAKVLFLRSAPAILCWEWKSSLTKWVQSLPTAFCCLRVLLGRAEENMVVEPAWAKSLKINWMRGKCCSWVWELLWHLLVVCSQAERENTNEWPSVRLCFCPTKMSYWRGKAKMFKNCCTVISNDDTQWICSIYTVQYRQV